MPHERAWNVSHLDKDQGHQWEPGTVGVRASAVLGPHLGHVHPPCPRVEAPSLGRTELLRGEGPPAPLPRPSQPGCPEPSYWAQAEGKWGFRGVGSSGPPRELLGHLSESQSGH